MTGARVAIVGTAISLRSDLPALELAPRDRKMMSPAAMLAAHCMSTLLRSVAWRDHEDIGCFLGVGASGGSLDEVLALVEASIVDDAISLPRFGDRGLGACHPLLAFQLMNNFTLCHGAIREALGGPNSAVFSRGAGTVTAITEAVHAIRSGDCTRAIAGGSDAPSHPVTLDELRRDGLIERGLVVTDAAALLALASLSPDDTTEVAHAVTIDGCGVASGRGRSPGAAIDEAFERAAGPRPVAPSQVVIAPWGPPAEAALRTWATARYPAATIVSTTDAYVSVSGDSSSRGSCVGGSVVGDSVVGDSVVGDSCVGDSCVGDPGVGDSVVGDSLAATPARAIVVAARRLAALAGLDGGHRIVVAVASLGIDGDPGIVLLSRGAS